MTDRHTCPHCNGFGTIPLTGIYADTLDTMRQLSRTGWKFIVANQAAHRFLCKPTALNNRLRRLEELGFVRSERFGRQRRFYLKGRK